MTEVIVDRLPITLLDGHELDDRALLRVARGASHVLALTTHRNHGAHETLAGRWARLAPDVPFCVACES